MDNENYFQNFKKLKEISKQKFQELKKKKLTELSQLCNENSLGHELYQRKESPMQIDSKICNGSQKTKRKKKT